MRSEVCLLMAAMVLAASPARPVAAAVVTERWSAGERGAYAGTVTIARLGEAPTISVDLSALPKEAKVYRSRLIARRETILGDDPRALVNVEIIPLGGDKPLALIGPWYRSFDATAVIRRAAATGKSSVTFLVKAFPGWQQETTALEITFEGKPNPNPPAVRELNAFHRSGQTFVTWREIETIVDGDTIRYGDLRPILDRLDESREIRYRIYRHTRPITAANLHEARLLADVPPLSALNLNARCIEYGIDKKLATTELLISNQEDPFGPRYVTTEKGVGLDYPVRRFVVVEGQGPLPAGTGLYVHAAAEAARSYYAVAVAVDGTESGDALAALAEPIQETTGDPQPVLQGKLPDSPYWRYPATRYHYVQWCGPPHFANLPNRAFSYGVSLPNKQPPDGRMPVEIHFHPRRYSYYRPLVRIRRDSLVASPYDFPLATAWYGYHEAIGTLKSFRQGAVHDYTDRRIVSFLTWARSRWKIDENRISTVGTIPPGGDSQDSGGSGAFWFGMKHRDFVNAVMASRPVIDPSTMPEETGPHYRKVPSDGYKQRIRVWGKRDWQLKTHDGGLVWHAQDTTPIITSHQPGDPLPLLGIGGWSEEIVEFLNLTRDKHLPLWNYSSYWSAPLPMVDGAAQSNLQLRCGVRLNRSLPAITHCSTDRVEQPRVELSSRCRWEGEALVDEPDRYEVNLYFVPYSYDVKQMTANVTPRRLQKFVVKGGRKYNWKSVAPTDHKVVQKGTTAAARDGLLTIEKVVLYKQPHLLIITPVE